MSGSEHFLKFWCRKIARRCGWKHILNSNKWGPGNTFSSSDVEKLHAAVARSAFWSQNVQKNWRSGSTFWSSDVEKLHAAVARSTFWSQNVPTKIEGPGALFEVQMSKNCTSMRTISQTWESSPSRTSSSYVSPGSTPIVRHHLTELECQSHMRSVQDICEQDRNPSFVIGKTVGIKSVTNSQNEDNLLIKLIRRKNFQTISLVQMRIKWYTAKEPFHCSLLLLEERPGGKRFVIDRENICTCRLWL